MASAFDPQGLIGALGALPLAMVVSNPRKTDNPLEVVNPAFCSLTGFSEQEAIGRNCRFLTGEETDVTDKRRLSSAIRGLQPTLVEILNYRRDGQPFRNGVMVTPLFDDNGDLQWFLGSQVDLGEADDSSLAGRRLAASRRVASLSQRQREVLSLMARGLLNKQIAWELKISEKTVKMHRSLLLPRLEARSTAEAIRIAVEAGL